MWTSTGTRTLGTVDFRVCAHAYTVVGERINVLSSWSSGRLEDIMSSQRRLVVIAADAKAKRRLKQSRFELWQHHL